MSAVPDATEDRIREYLRAHYARMVAGLSLACGSRALAEDAVQEALCKAWEREMRGEQIESFRAWVATVATNDARSRLRRIAAEARMRDRLRRKTMGREDVSPNTENAEMRVDLEKAMMRLPRRQREVLALRYFADLDIQEIADGMGVKEGTVKALLFRGRHALADSIGQPEADDPDER